MHLYFIREEETEIIVLEEHICLLHFNRSKLKQLCCRAQYLTTHRGTNDASGPQGGEDYPGQGRRAGLGQEGLEGASIFTQSNSSLTLSSEDSLDLASDSDHIRSHH